MILSTLLVISVTYHHHTNNHLLFPGGIESLDQKFNNLFFRQTSVSIHMGFSIILHLKEGKRTVELIAETTHLAVVLASLI